MAEPVEKSASQSEAETLEPVWSILPQEVLEVVCKYLTVKELVACCAVSSGWREVFDCDILWRLRCDQELCRYLQDTPCLVEPVFLSPVVEGSGLSEVCEWRLQYMRQTHYFNNWRSGRYKRDCLENGLSGARFYNDQVIVLSNRCNEVLLLDINHSPPKILTQLPLFFDNTCVDFLDVVDENIVLTQKNMTQIFAPPVNHESEWSMVHSFKWCNNFTLRCQFYLAGKILIIKFLEGNFKLWDIKTGLLVREEESVEGLKCHLLPPSSPSMVVFKSNQEISRDKCLFLYDLENLKFVPLTTKSAFYPMTFRCLLYSNLLICSAVHKYCCNTGIEIYNYEKNELVAFLTYKRPLMSSPCNIQLFKKDVILHDDVFVRRLNLTTKEMDMMYESSAPGNFHFVQNKCILFSQKIPNSIKLCFAGNKYQANNLMVDSNTLTSSNIHGTKLITITHNPDDYSSSGPFFLLHLW